MNAADPALLAAAPTSAPEPKPSLFDVAEPLDQTPALGPQRTFAGFTQRDLMMMAVGLVFSLWAIWATSALIELRQRRIVSVSLSTIIKDFVSAQSRSAATPEIAAARTKAYLVAVDAAMQSMSRDGTTVLVSEAVVGNSVPDMTSAVSAAVNDWLSKAPPVTVSSPSPGQGARALVMPDAGSQGAPSTGNPFAGAGNGN